MRITNRELSPRELSNYGAKPLPSGSGYMRV